MLRWFAERYEPPTARVEPSYVVIRTGEMVEVRCIVTGYPEPSVEWTYTAGSLPSDARVRDGLLRFRATRRTEGEYRCMATSSVGEDHATVTVVIEGINYLRQRRRYMFLPVFVCLSVCLSVCLCARLLKNGCVDLDEMLRVDRCRDMDEFIKF